MGFADGALRLLPGFLEFQAFGFTFSFNVMIGAILLIPFIYTVLGAYPFVERWVTGDTREHHLLDRPRNNPTRTGLGVGAITFYVVLFLAAGNDLMAIKLHLSINDITRMFQVLVFVGPPVAFWITKRICLSLQRADRQKVLHGRETGIIWRYADGRFEEIHAPLNEYERWNLVQHEVPEPLALTAETDANGVASPVARKERLRAKLSHFYFKDRVAPPTPAELEEAHHEHIAGHGVEVTEVPEAIEALEAVEAVEAVESGDGATAARETVKADRKP
jgi:ubiquinol-cytochrome c reductase cytochrome b subunit